MKKKKERLKGKDLFYRIILYLTILGFIISFFFIESSENSLIWIYQILLFYLCGAIFWISMIIEAWKENKHGWAILTFFIPIISIFYYIFSYKTGKCPICKKEFETQEELKKHILKKHTK